MKVKVKLNIPNIKGIEKIARESLVDTADVIKTDLQLSQTMPFDTGQLQNRSTYVEEKTKDKVSIVSDTPYARRLYFHPEYRFKKDNNKNAGGLWFEPYINGEKKGVPAILFIKIMKGRLK